MRSIKDKHKKLNIDFKKHMGCSVSAEKGIKARFRMKHSPQECEHLMEKTGRKYEQVLKDLPYCGADFECSNIHSMNM